MQSKKANYKCQMQLALTSNQLKLLRSTSSKSHQNITELESGIGLQDLHGSPSFVSRTTVYSLHDTSSGISVGKNKDAFVEIDNPNNCYNGNIKSSKCGHNENIKLSISKQSGHQYSSFSSELEQIFIKTISGKTLTIQVRPNDTIDSIKGKIKIREGISQDMQHVVFAGKLLVNGHTVSYYNIHTGSTLHLTLCLCGGAETIAELIDLYMSTRIEYPHINEFIGLNKFVLYEMGWDPVKIREEWNKGLGRHGIKDRPDWKTLKQEYETVISKE